MMSLQTRSRGLPFIARTPTELFGVIMHHVSKWRSLLGMF